MRGCNAEYTQISKRNEYANINIKEVQESEIREKICGEGSGSSRARYLPFSYVLVRIGAEGGPSPMAVPASIHTLYSVQLLRLVSK